MIQNKRYTKEDILKLMHTKKFPEKYNVILRKQGKRLQVFCKYCSTWKYYEQFHLRDNPLGIRLTCKTCVKAQINTEHKKAYYEKNKEELRRWHKQYYQQNKGYYKQKYNEWKARNPEYSKVAYQKRLNKYLFSNKFHYQEVIKKNKESYQRHLDACKRWRDNNPGWWKKYQKK